MKHKALPEKREHPLIKSSLHPRNKHRERYNFQLLISAYPELSRFVSTNKFQDESIDFFNPIAVKALNTALLKQYYDIENWSIPENYLCPPIPGRADYIHHIADLLYSNSSKLQTNNKKIICLDIGVGANCIYPIIGNCEYGWSFIGSDTDQVAIENAKKIIESNPLLAGNIEVRFQTNPKNIFKGIIRKDEFFDLTVCNPPFHSSASEAFSSAHRKVNKLKNKMVVKPLLNFGGKSNELWYEGGEDGFVQNMILESVEMASNVFWFSTLISKQSNLSKAYSLLKKVKATEVVTLPMGQGNKISRILAWTFLDKELRQNWKDSRWE